MAAVPEMGFEKFELPPCSLDLALGDYYLFPWFMEIKNTSEARNLKTIVK